MPRRFYSSGRRARNRFGNRSGGYRRNRRNLPSLMQLTITKAPKPTNSRLIFKWQPSLNKYDTSNFSPPQTDNRMTSQEKDDIFESLKSAKLYSAGHGEDPFQVCLAVTFSMAIMFFLLFLFVLLLMQSSIFIIFFPILFLLSALCVLYCFFGFINRSSKWHMDRLTQRERSLKEILTDLNRAKYDAKGIYLKVGTYGAWIEFELTYKYNQNGQGLGVATADHSRNSNNPLRSDGLFRPSGGRMNPTGVPSRPRTPQSNPNVARNQIQPLNIADARPAQISRPYMPPAARNPLPGEQSPENDLPPILDVEVPEQKKESTEFQNANLNYPAPPTDNKEYAKVYNNAI